MNYPIFVTNKNLRVISIYGLGVIIVVLSILIYNQSIANNQAHDQWYNAWKNGIATTDDCKWLKSGLEDHPESELVPLLKQRIGELNCP